MHKNLLSVSRMVQNVCRVVFSEAESYIETKDGTRIDLESRNGVFILSGSLMEMGGQRRKKSVCPCQSFRQTGQKNPAPA